jgi:hypothetical protein
METRRDLIGEYPLLAQISAPETDKDAYIPVHPGAAAYFAGEQKTIFDQYGDQLFYASMLIGTLTSIFAGLWKFMAKDVEEQTVPPVGALFSLVQQINTATSEADLAMIEERIDAVLETQLMKDGSDQAEPANATALALATHRLEQAMIRRRRSFDRS